MTERSTQITLYSEEEMTRLGQWLAPQLRAGDVILLSGPIGAGKTHLARAIIKARLAALGRDEDVPSPTFTLVQTYGGGAAEIWHADLYRLSHPNEAEELGLADAFETAICLVEWPDRLGSLTPQGALWITLSAPADMEGREAVLAGGDRWSSLLAAMATGVIPNV
ncbi:MAG: tRNA (adenosine(37)-N6)-threonylcarbamoyltransferase complex ATPase subunit type 1 TsaE [Paracoccaceae bacterium]|nr:tRNA (adenosine(37)-N6)-threonylcarbamoyltransferase complex ATPase subunit type 1 TsaE [Paracoccaceae bacterium]